MTSRFVSGGTIAGEGTETEVGVRAGVGAGNSTATAKAAVEWEAVQKDLDEERRRREEARKAAVEGGAGGGERSLYEVLQANKAAKQAAFEEQNRIRNQFRALDDDEIEFLHGVSDEKRLEEERLRHETEVRLANFRKAQQEQQGGDDDAGDADGNVNGDIGVGSEEWGATTMGRKRKREKDKVTGLLKGVRRRMTEVHDHELGEGHRSKTAGEGLEAGEGAEKESRPRGDSAVSPVESTTGATPTKPGDILSSTTAAISPAETLANPNLNSTSAPKKPALGGLVDYGSDEDDEDD